LQPFDRKDGGEKIDPQWETRHGHCAAALRYLTLSDPEGGEQPYEPAEDPRQEFHRELIRRSEESEPVAYGTRFIV
jgi:hypothetical protein